MKTCFKCKEAKTSESFGVNNKNKDGLQSYCKKCRSHYMTALNNNKKIEQTKAIFITDIDGKEFEVKQCNCCNKLKPIELYFIYTQYPEYKNTCNSCTEIKVNERIANEKLTQNTNNIQQIMGYDKLIQKINFEIKDTISKCLLGVDIDDLKEKIDYIYRSLK